MTSLPPEFGGQELTGSAAELWEAAQAGDSMAFKIERGEIQPGRSISREALERTVEMMTAFIEARIIERWQRSSEPPTSITIELTVNAA